MRILIDEHSGHKIHLVFPSSLLLNRVAARFASKMLAKNDIPISPEQVNCFVKELRHFKRRHKDWKIIELQSADGDMIEIQL